MAYRDRLLASYQAAYLLGYRSTDARPESKEDRLSLQAFRNAQCDGTIPAPDAYINTSPRWKESTLVAFIERGGTKPKNKLGRKRKAVAGDVGGTVAE